MNRCLRVLLFLTFFALFSVDCLADGLDSNPYVTFSPDGEAWTTNEGDCAIEWYDVGTTVTIGAGICIPEVTEGHHEYTYYRTGAVPVGEWRVRWTPSKCIHPASGGGWHGLNYPNVSCGNPFFSGWVCYCADCGQLIEPYSIYMSMDAARSLEYMQIDMDYYYRCPWCMNLEQGVGFEGHECRGVSGNRYRIHYDPNTDGAYTGNMPDSYHMYDNEAYYEGEAVTRSESLLTNRFEREGWFFGGWNTKPDGTGKSFCDGERILNLTEEDCVRNPEGGTVTLYARWITLEELIFTRGLAVSEGENTHYSEAEKVYYVRSDGITSFGVNYEAFLDVPEGFLGCIDRGLLECVTGEQNAVITTFLRDGGFGREDGIVQDSLIDLKVQGDSILKLCGKPDAFRSNILRDIRLAQRFVIEKGDSGKRVEIVPRAGVGIGSLEFWSDKNLDISHRIVIAADGEAPVLYGTEIFENLPDTKLIDADEGQIVTDIHAKDALSGLDEIYVRIRNLDNGQIRDFFPGEDGHIRIAFSCEELFAGDFSVEIYAKDHVGNVAFYQTKLTEFALHASVGRILAPHDPVFEAGESGILTIETWGYVDRVEVVFPDSLTCRNPDLNKVFTYAEEKAFKQTEKLKFMIPLYTEDCPAYEITVRAYKADRKLEEHPRLNVIKVEGTVLKHLRTRLR